MMKTIILISLFICTCIIGFSQNQTVIDSLKNQLANEQQDTNRVLIMLKLEGAFSDNSKPDSAKAYAEKALDLATKIHYPNGEFEALISLASHHRLIGDSPKSLFYAFKGLRLAEKMRDRPKKARILFQLVRIYYLGLTDYQKAKSYSKQTIREYEALNDIENLAAAEASLSTIYRGTNQLDSMLSYQQRAYAKYEKIKKIDTDGRFLMQLAGNYIAMDNYPLALSLFQKARIVNHSQKMWYNESNSLEGIASVYKKMNQLDSAIYYNKKVIELGTPYDYKQFLIVAYKDLGDIYKTQKKDSAYYFLKMAWDINESINGTQKIIALETTISEEQERQYQAEAERIASQNRIKQYLFLGGVGILVLIAFLLYNNNRQKQKANNLLYQQKQEIDFQRDKAEKALVELKSTQAQLIQSEKLASLGELTAGIAHEIQNPLNFVNNFSELSVELLEELKSPLTPEGGIREGEKMDMELFGDVMQNLEKISLHGKRASSIVKGMLEHSRISTGEKELTDINALADEYLRLAYHGMRAKDSSGPTSRFNADFKTDLDENLPKIKVIPQDFGRVLLNLINNAFYACAERSKKGETAYKPKVTVRTQLKANSQLLIAIKDNGIGMSEETKAKIFQPFFTTKPTGEGTGLGLSLAYDIVTKGHGGSIECESVEGEGTKFVVKLPI
jgi:two-component system, NtrC family, sensor kinase